MWLHSDSVWGVHEFIHWKLRAITMPTLSSMVTPQVVMATTCGAVPPVTIKSTTWQPMLPLYLLTVVLGDKTYVHYDDVIMDKMASQITSLTIVYSTVYSGADQSKHQSSASVAFVWGIHRGPVNSPHKWPVTRKMLPFDDVIIANCNQTFWIRFLLKPYKSGTLFQGVCHCHRHPFLN